MLRKLLTYFLLLNFLNTIFFTEIMVQSAPVAGKIAVSEATDEIDSVLEFVLEQCLELPEDLLNDDFDELPDDLNRTVFDKDFIYPERIYFAELEAATNFCFPLYISRLVISNSDIHSPPPEYFS